MSRFIACGIVCLVAAGATLPCFGGETILAGGPVGFRALRLVPISNVNARLKADAKGAKITFEKTGEIRRLLVVKARPADALEAPRALALGCRVTLDRGQPPRPAVVIYERGGGVWFHVRGRPVATGEWAEERVSIRGLREAAFSSDASGKLEWDQVEKVWVGLAIDGPAAGVFELGQAGFTDEPYRPTHPLRVTGAGAGEWGVSKDKAAKAKVTTPDEGPDGQPCMKAEFTLPGGRHMYMVPSTALGDVEKEGYRALRFKYRATLPKGLKGLLVMLIESDGSPYIADPAPPASEEWTTITIPLEELKLGSWGKDPDGRLDLSEVASVAIGTHGTPSDAGGDGVILATDIEFVP